MLDEYVDFLSAEGRNVQRYDKARRGLVSFKRSQKTKTIPLELHGAEIVLRHCPKSGTKLSKVQLLVLERSLHSRLSYIQESALGGKWSFVGEALNQSVFGEGINCQTCRTRFSLRILFDREKVAQLLAKLQVTPHPLRGP